jgi:hypothetical protein
MGLKQRLPVAVFFTVMLGIFVIGCEPENNRLGVDIFPSQDTIIVFTDTITELETMLVRSRPRITSINNKNLDEDRVFLLGSMVDTITGLSKADIVTEFGLTPIGNFGEDPYIDSLSLWLYIDDVVGDADREMHISIYEFLDDLSMESDYYSDYDVTGKYDPVPIVDTIIIPTPKTAIEFKLDNPGLLNRILEATNPSDSVFVINANLQEVFKGLYITSETYTEGGAMVKLQLANDLAGLKFKYHHDSITGIAADTIPLSTYNITFNEFYAQKVNIFHHDFTGTAVESLLDDPDAEPGIAYAQGMTGINVKVTIPDFDQYFVGEQIAINSARLLFYVVPDSLSGISRVDYPERLTMEAELDDGSFVKLYDQVINTDPFAFGKLNQSNEISAFLDPLYYYSFSLGRHFQSMISGELDRSDFYIFVDDPVTNPQIIKFWSNHSGVEGGLRLELIYSKF